MEKNNSWVISDTIDYTSANQTARPMSRQAKRRAMANTRTAELPRSRVKAKKANGTAVMMLVLAVVFMLCIGLLFQKSIISERNEEIRSARAELTQKQEINDSKNGQILSSLEDGSIEAAARSYGMTEPTADQYVYETTDNSQNNTDTTQGN